MFFRSLFSKKAIPPLTLPVGDRELPVEFVHNPKARRYWLRLRMDRGARVTIPRGGSATHAHAFALKHLDWLEHQLARRAQVPENNAWQTGTKIFLRGEVVMIERREDAIHVGSERICDPGTEQLKPAIQNHFLKLAQRELPARTQELAQLHGIEVKRVSVRNQKTRWGSCSTKGTISLNWRLVQAPFLVRDYIILHELAHRRHMNHSQNFWREVERLCPGYLEAERWLKRHGREVMRA